MKHKFLAKLIGGSAALIATLALLAPYQAKSCTSAIFTGKVTKDGRPLMWKNCDTKNLNHRLVFSRDNGYAYIGVTRETTQNLTGTNASIWMGTNEHGFTIMNTAGYNLEPKKDSDGSDNGVYMRIALESCKTIADFKKFLDKQPRPMKVHTHFGVIDAHGGAGYFETYSQGYYFFDANDPKTAPGGYIIRSNYAFAGEKDKGAGYIRYETAAHIVDKAYAEKAGFTPQWIINNLARSYYHSLMDVDFLSAEALDLFEAFIPDSDFIPRLSTATSCVMQGVQPGEKPELGTFWVCLGYTPCGMIMPAWVKAGAENIPILMGGGKSAYRAKACDMALDLKANVFSVHRGNGQNYLDRSKVYNLQGTGYMQRIAPVENYVVALTDPKIDAWRKKGAVNNAEMQELIKQINAYVLQNFPTK